MRDVEYIRYLYEEEGLSLSEIARRTEHDFRTVRKYAHQNDWSPKVKVSVQGKSFPVIGPYIGIIDNWLMQDENEPRKQRHTMIRIYDRLKREHGFTGSYCSVKRYVNRKRDTLKKSKEGFLPIAKPMAHAQADFGKFKYYDAAGMPHKGYALIVSFPYSNAAWMQVFRSENQECLLTGLKRIFNHIGGTPRQLRLDNMTTAVVQILSGTERVLTDGFIRFKFHYRFAAEFCNPARGNEKGNVENKVGYTRRNMLVPIPVIMDFDEYNRELLILCDKDHGREHYKHDKTLLELWEEEKRHLLTLPEHEYDVFRYESLPVNKQGFVRVDNAKYGLSPEMNGRIVQAKIYFDRIEVYEDRSLLKTFTRSYLKNDEVFDWRTYLPALTKKPGAVPHTRFFNQMPKLWQEHLRSINNRERKSALTVLMEIVKDGNDSLCDDALELAQENGRTDSDSIRQCYYLISKQENYPKELKLSSSPTRSGYTPDLYAYDILFINRLGTDGDYDNDKSLGKSLDGGDKA
jgi:transposase